MQEDQSLALIDAVRLALEKAASVQEIKEVISQSAAAETYARQAKLGKEIELQMHEYVLHAERRLGEMLEAAKAAGQITHKHGNPKYENKVVDSNDNLPVKLADAGISRDLSSRAQKLAKIPKEEFERRIAQGKQNGKLSANQILNNNKEISANQAKKPIPLKNREKEEEVIRLYKAGVSNKEISEQTEVRPRVIDSIINGYKHFLRGTEATITPDMISLTAKEKAELYCKQRLKKLNDGYEADVQARVQERVEAYLGGVSKRWQDIYSESKRIRDKHIGFMTKTVYRKILSCLHGDWIAKALADDPTMQKRYQEAFIEFNKLAPFLMNEKENPTNYPPIPKTMAEWQEHRRKTTEARKAKRQAKGGIVTS